MQEKLSEKKPQWKAIVELALMFFFLFHILAIIAEPFRFFSRTDRQVASADIAPIRNAISPYVEFLFLNHGYFFFAPNPGPSHITEVVEIDQNGGLSRIAELPSRQEHFPRLKYHRHFMFSEFYNNVAVPMNLVQIIESREGQLDESMLAEARNAVNIYESLQASIQRRLVAAGKVNAERSSSLRIRRIEHAMPSIEQFYSDEAPVRLTDGRLYQILPEENDLNGAGFFRGERAFGGEEIPARPVELNDRASFGTLLDQDAEDEGELKLGPEDADASEDR